MPFEATSAVRKPTPVLTALYGPSGSGKTFSALRLAAGHERVTRKPTFVIDTENGRALHYADDFKFMHVPFDPPFTSERYLEALEFCFKQGAGQIVIDSGSHEHEGEGGLLERQYETALKMARGDTSRVDAYNMPAWQVVKKPHNRLRIAIARPLVHQIWCFRAKEKNTVGKDPKTGKQKISNIGFMPVGGSDLIYEMTLSGLLLPGSRGVPTWQSELAGEGVTIKVPGQFEKLVAALKGPINEDLGERLAQWGAAKAAGDRESLAFDPRWSNREWAGKPFDAAPLAVLNEYMNALERRGTIPSIITQYFDERSARELAP